MNLSDGTSKCKTIIIYMFYLFVRHCTWIGLCMTMYFNEFSIIFKGLAFLEFNLILRLLTVILLITFSWNHTFSFILIQLLIH